MKTYEVGTKFDKRFENGLNAVKSHVSIAEIRNGCGRNCNRLAAGA